MADDAAAPRVSGGAATQRITATRGMRISRTAATRIAIAIVLVVLLIAASAYAVGQRRPGFDHVYVIVLENHGYGQIVGNPEAPYLNSLIKGYGLAANYDAVAHPSQPNYITMLTGSNDGVADDANHEISARSLLDQLEQHGLSWHVYAQDYPGSCFTGAYASGGVDLVGAAGEYARHHNPAISLTSVSGNPKRCANISSLASFDPATASFEMIVPNDSNNMHSGSVAAGDAFLRAFVPRILSSAAFSNSVLFITFDEGTTNEAGGGRVPLIVVRPGIKPGFRSPVAHTHRALLRTIEDSWHLGCLQGACSAPPLSEFFTG